MLLSTAWKDSEEARFWTPLIEYTFGGSLEEVAAIKRKIPIRDTQDLDQEDEIFRGLMARRS